MYLEDEKGTISSHYNLALNTNYDASRMDSNRGINYRECEGYDHVQEECSNILSYATTWSGEDSENNKDGEDIFSKLAALISHSTKHIIKVSPGFLAMFQHLVHKMAYQVVKQITPFLHLVN